MCNLKTLQEHSQIHRSMRCWKKITKHEITSLDITFVDGSVQIRVVNLDWRPASAFVFRREDERERDRRSHCFRTLLEGRVSQRRLEQWTIGDKEGVEKEASNSLWGVKVVAGDSWRRRKLARVSEGCGWGGGNSWRRRKLGFLRVEISGQLDKVIRSFSLYMRVTNRGE